MYNWSQGARIQNKVIAEQRLTPTSAEPVAITVKGRVFYVSSKDAIEFSQSESRYFPIWLGFAVTLIANLRVVTGGFDFFKRPAR